jgi:hypothetical protein
VSVAKVVEADPGEELGLGALVFGLGCDLRVVVLLESFEDPGDPVLVVSLAILPCEDKVAVRPQFAPADPLFELGLAPRLQHRHRHGV